MKNIFEGRTWKFGDNIDTDQIIPAEFLVTMDKSELAKHLFEKNRPGFSRKVARGDIIVAGRNFGCGSSREHAPRALLGAGVSCVVAESFARIFYRNAINIGLPVIEAKIRIEEGDNLRVDLASGTVENRRTADKASFKAYPPFVMMLMQKGGLVPYTKERLGCTK
ncbi:MAG: 3-isopropylmalate dehydratase small subunit [Euryarchaeota archaeon RBG_13_57_23]|nr:MAG: 3-isopropylmalate dehydratase small subunit [Euryarchaeota archaeon RBG_13_57_23]